MKKGYTKNIEQATLDNTNFRQVEYTGQHMQLVLMSLNPGEEIGLETHPDNDQFFRFESGEGKVIVGETTYIVGDGDVVIIPAGVEHNIINTSSIESLKCYTIYATPHHKDGITHITKEIAERDEEEFDGITTE
jgi:mannose-6-phosphate isomerase-like protein (cupin superfamily)